MWTQKQAIDLAVLVESVIPPFGAHVALTGGTLYKHGDRKDCDLLIYRIRQRPSIDMEPMWVALAAVGLKKISGFGWCYKATYDEKSVDIFFPEAARGKDGKEIDYSP